VADLLSPKMQRRIFAANNLQLITSRIIMRIPPLAALLMTLWIPFDVSANTLIKTKCYITESPEGEVCIFQDRRSLGSRFNLYVDSCPGEPKLDPRLLISSELRVFDKGGIETDRRRIGSVMTLELSKVRVDNLKTFFASTQNINGDSFGACSNYSQGRLDTPFWVIDGKINFVLLDELRPKSFRSTLKQTWAPVKDGFLEAESVPCSWRKEIKVCEKIQKSSLQFIDDFNSTRKSGKLSKE